MRPRPFTFRAGLLFAAAALPMLDVARVATALNPVPADFCRRLDQGWLPPICARQDDPHTPRPTMRPWAASRVGGGTRVLFICASPYQYEALSLARSFDLACDVVPLWPSYAWRENDADPDTMNLLRYCLSRRSYAAIAMAGGWTSALPTDCQQRLAELVQRDGVGFVYALPGIMPRVPSMQGTPSPALDPLLPLSADASGYKATTSGVAAVGSHALARGSDFAGMRWVSNTDVSVAAGDTVVLRAPAQDRVLVAAATRGKGRVVAYNRCYGEMTYAYPFLPLPVPADEKAAPETQAGKRGRWLDGTEYADQFYGWLGRAILWAGHAEPAVSLKAVDIAQGTLDLTTANTPAGHVRAAVRVIVRAPYDSFRKTADAVLDVPAGGETHLAIALPDTGCLGRGHVDVFLLNDQERVWDWASLPLERRGTLAVHREPDFTFYAPDADVPVRLRIETPAGHESGRIRLELADLEGRLLADQKQTIRLDKQKPTELLMSVPLGKAGITTRLANLRVTVQVGGETVEVRDQLFVRQGPQWDSLHIMAYTGMGWYGHPDDDVLVNVLKGMGHDTLIVGYPTPFKLRMNTETGCRIVVNNLAPWCQFDAGRLKTLTEWARRFSPVIYELQDEPELQVMPAAEARYDSPTDMSRFRQWLKRQYGTPQALSAAWGGRYADWQGVKRMLWYEVADTDNWAPWFDSRRELDQEFVDRYGSFADAVRSVVPDGLTDINPRSVSALAGVDLREITRRLGASSLYCNFTARAPMGFLELASRWVPVAMSAVGYTWPSSPGVEAITREAWDAVRLGARNLIWFAPNCDETPPVGRFSFLDGNLAPNAKGLAIAEVNRQLLAGPGDLATVTDRLQEGIFVYYPRTLFYAHTLAYMRRQRDGNPKLDPAGLQGIGPWMEMLPCSFVPSLRCLGYQFEFGDEQDLTRERLKRTRVVFLSHVIALGPRELDLLGEFVKAGGTVIAEAGTGRRDASGRAYAETPPAFRELFGVERRRPNLSPIVEREDVTPCGAERLEGVSPYLGPTYRKGKAFFLDFRLPATFDACMLVARLLDESGVRSTYALRDNYMEYDSSTLIASLVVRRRKNLDYLYLTGDGNRRDSAFAIDLPAFRYVTDVVSGKDLGRLSRIEGNINYGQARLFALAPSPVASFVASASGTRCRPGETVTIRFALATEGNDPGDRLIRLEYLAATPGKCPPMPITLLLSAGRGELKLVLPLNTSTGVVQVRATDLTSGTKCLAHFEILPQSR